MLTIGEFSRLAHVSARMLRHYDLIGLLRPAHTGAENGYRYYDAAQAETLSRIEQLKRYGFSLAEVAELLALPEAEQAKRIHARRVGMYGEVNTLRQTIRQLEDDIIQMEGIEMALEKYHVIVMEAPAQRVFSLRRTINVGQTHELFQELRREAEKRGYTRTGATQLLYRGEEFSYDSMDVEAQMEVAGEGEGITTHPGGTFAAVTHTGPYEGVKYAYDALAAWMAQHPEYRVCGPAVERYIKDEGMTSDPEEYETGVLMPVEKV